MSVPVPDDVLSIKVAGAISGVVQLRPETGGTVGALRQEVARLASCDTSAVKLISGGMTLRDDSWPLCKCGLGPGSRVLVTKGAGAAAALSAAAAAQQQWEHREARLEKLRAVVEKLSSRGDGRGLSDKYEFDLQNQDGTRLMLDPGDRKALVTGLALHSKGQASMAAAAKASRRACRPGGGGGGGGGAGDAATAGEEPPVQGEAVAAAAAAGDAPGAGRLGGDGDSSGGGGAAGVAGRDQLQQALEELLLAEEAFELVTDKQLLRSVDNVAMLLLDIVWCSYLLQDIGRLGVSAERLARARAMLAAAHGPNLERLRVLHGGFSPEAAIYVRLEAMEGVVAFHGGDHAAAARHLQAAGEKLRRLQVSPESLAALQEMGYSKKEASRALRFCGGDPAAAVAFIGEQRTKQQERAAERRRQRAWQRERSQYGKTPSGAHVDREPLEQLAGPLGYERVVAAEALRAADNDLQSALDALTDPVRSGALQLAILARQIKEADEGPQDVSARDARRLAEMGFDPKAARVALKEADGSFEGALERLAAAGDAARRAPAAGAAAAAAEGGGGARRRRRDGGAAAGGEGERGGAGEGSSSEADSEEERLEEALVAAARGGDDDPMSAYDLDLGDEEEAIRRYTAAVQQGQGR